MASDDTGMTILQLHSSSLQLEGEDEGEIEDGNDEDYHHRHASHPNYLSRLSICNTSDSDSKPPTFTPNLYDDDDDGVGADITDMGLDMARLSIESFSEDEDADEELSDGKEGRNKNVPIGMSSDSDKETGCHSLPSTQPWMRRGRARPFGYDSGNLLALGLKEYASENEAQRTTTITTRRRRSCFRKMTTTYCCSSPSSSSSSWTRKRLAGPAMTDRDRQGTRWGLGLERAWDEKKNNHHHKYGKVKAGEEDEEEEEDEKEGSECVVITRPKGGGRALCMDWVEVKACRDLGFELDHERMMMVDTPSTPGRISIAVPTASTIDFDTSSGGNSPIANWRISSPGDDPRDVKARLKVWAQAVALASTSRHVS